MKISLNWQIVIKEIDPVTGKEVPSELDRNYLWLDIGIKGLSENEAYEFQNILEDAINRNTARLYGKTSFSRCTGYGDVKAGELHDYCGWKRWFGCIREQKEDIRYCVRKAFEETKEIFLEKQEERKER